jgi:hypothetical protein
MCLFEKQKIGVITLKHSWFAPPIGHLGIATSDGTLHDFAGPYYIRTDPHTLAFGPVCKFVAVDVHADLHPTAVDETSDRVGLWDRAVMEADEEYRNLSHNLIWYYLFVCFRFFVFSHTNQFVATIVMIMLQLY